MDERQHMEEPFIRPTARVNNWQPSYQIHGPGTKSTRTVSRTDWVRRRAGTIVRRENVPRVMRPAFDDSRINQRSQSLNALNLIQLTSPEKLNFNQKRQLLSSHIRASWIVTDYHKEARSCGLIYPLDSIPSGILGDTTKPVNSFDITVNRDRILESRNHLTFAANAPSRELDEAMREEQECIHAFYRSLRSEVLSAPVTVTLFTRSVQEASMDKMLLQSIDSCHQWQRIGQGRLVVLARRESCSSMDISSVKLQLCQPKTLYPLWCGTIALPKLNGKLGDQKQRCSMHALGGVLDSTRQLSGMLYNQLMDDVNPVHLAFVSRSNPSANNKGWQRLSMRHRSLQQNGTFPLGRVEGKEFMICQWRFECDLQSSPSTSEMLNAFFDSVRDLVDRALIYRFRTRIKRSEVVNDQSKTTSRAISSPRRIPMSDRPILKSQISAPCMFRHLSSLKPEDVEHFRGKTNTQFYLQSLQAR